MKTIKVNDGTFTTEDFQHSREIELIGEVAQALRDANQDLPPRIAPRRLGRFGIEFTNGDKPGVKLTATKARKSDHWAADQSRARMVARPPRSKSRNVHEQSSSTGDRGKAGFRA